jgi:hypothetical protein
MPKVEQADINITHLADYFDPPVERTGIHVTDLIRLALKNAGQKVPEYGDSEVSKGMMAMGKIWEWQVGIYVTGWVLASSSLVPMMKISRSLDGVDASLDGLLEDDTATDAYGGSVVVECKCRFSKPHDPQARGDWMMQVKAYCYMAGVTKALMPILFLPSAPPAPEVRFYWLDFTPAELRENWDMLMHTKRYYLEHPQEVTA